MRFVQRSSLELCPIISVDAVPSGTPGATVGGTLYTLTTETVTLSAAHNNWQFALYAPIGSDEIEVENLTPSISDITNWPLVERVSAGIGRVRLNYRGLSASRSLDMRDLSGGSTTYTITGFQADTLGDYTLGIVEPLLIEGGDLNLLLGGVETGGDWNFGAATYNAGCWAAAFDFTGVAHKNSANSTPKFAGTAITDRHVLMASHYLPAVGTVLTFIAADGTKVTRTILAYNSGNTFNGKINLNPVVRDIAVAVLSGPDLTDDGITVYPVVGDWIFTEQTVNSTNDSVVAGWVGFKLDQDRRVLLAGRADLYPVSKGPETAVYEGQTLTKDISGVGTDFGASVNLPDFLATYSAFYAQSVSGDSGTPRFIPKEDGSLILVACVTGAGGDAPFPAENILNACIASADSHAGISTGLTVTVAPDPTL